MTDKEIEMAKDMLPKWKNGIPPKYTDEQRIEVKCLQCRDMINSILCYNGITALRNNRYLKDYEDELGMDVVRQLCDEQIADFKKAKVLRNVFTDSEGLSYNSIQWADEM